MQVARLIEPRSERNVLAKLRQMVRAVELERALQQGRNPCALSLARALWRQSRRRARGLARLFRQGAEAADALGGGAAGGAAAIAGSAAARPFARSREARARPRARPHRRRHSAFPPTRSRAPRPISMPSERQADAGARAACRRSGVAVGAADANGTNSPSMRGCSARSKLWRASAPASFGAEVSIAIVAVDHASGEILARVASSDYFDLEPGRAGGPDAGAAFAGLRAQAVHLRARLRGRARASRHADRRPADPLRQLRAGEFRSHLPGHRAGAQGAAIVAQRAGGGVARPGRALRG